MSFVFANKLGEKVSKSYNNPYDAYQNRTFNNELCLVSDNLVVIKILDTKMILVKNLVMKIFDTKMILVKWTVSCAKHVLHIFEEQNPDDKKPRKAIEAAINWIKDPSEKNKKDCRDASYNYNHTNQTFPQKFDIKAINPVYFASNAIANASLAVSVAAYYTNPNDSYIYYYTTERALNAALKASPNKSLEIKWQIKKLNQIVYEEVILLLVKSQYHRIDNKLVRKIPKELLEYIVSFIIG